MALGSYQPKATIDAGTPADKLLAMMTELLDGGLPNLQDILLVQSTILEVCAFGSGAGSWGRPGQPAPPPSLDPCQHHSACLVCAERAVFNPPSMSAPPPARRATSTSRSA